MRRRCILVVAALAFVTAIAGCDDGTSFTPGVVPAPPLATKIPPPETEAPTTSISQHIIAALAEQHQLPALTDLHMAATTAAEDQKPSAPPSNLRALSTPTSITWEWDEVKDAILYGVQVSRNDRFTSLDPIAYRYVRSFILRGLEPNTLAYVRVIAFLGDSTTRGPLRVSAWSEAKRGTSLREPDLNAPTLIGFAEPARAHLVDGGLVRAHIAVSNGPLRKAQRVRVGINDPSVLRFPGSERGFVDLVIPESGRSSVEIKVPAKHRSETLPIYRVTLYEPSEGLSDGVKLDSAATQFYVLVSESGDPTSVCEQWRFNSAQEDFNSDGEFSTATLTIEGPQRIQVRLREPYMQGFWDERDRGNLPSDVPVVTTAIPNRLSFRRFSDGVHRREIGMSWSGDLTLEAYAPECFSTRRVHCWVERGRLGRNRTRCTYRIPEGNTRNRNGS